jgi:hypothetical protein
MVSEEKNFKNQPIRNKNRLWWPCLLTDRIGMSNLYRCFLPSFGSFGKAVWEKTFRNRPIRNKNCLWRPCLLTDRDRNTMHKFVRGPSIDASYQVTVHLVKRFQRRSFFRNQPMRNKNCPWWPCLSTDRDEMSNPYREPPIDASYIVSVHLAKQFQRRRFLKIGQ